MYDELNWNQALKKCTLIEVAEVGGVGLAVIVALVLAVTANEAKPVVVVAGSE